MGRDHYPVDVDVMLTLDVVIMYKEIRNELD